MNLLRFQPGVWSTALPNPPSPLNEGNSIKRLIVLHFICLKNGGTVRQMFQMEKLDRIGAVLYCIWILKMLRPAKMIRCEVKWITITPELLADELITHTHTHICYFIPSSSAWPTFHFFVNPPCLPHLFTSSSLCPPLTLPPWYSPLFSLPPVSPSAVCCCLWLMELDGCFPVKEIQLDSQT